MTQYVHTPHKLRLQGRILSNVFIKSSERGFQHFHAKQGLAHETACIVQYCWPVGQRGGGPKVMVVCTVIVEHCELLAVAIRVVGQYVQCSTF